MKQSPLKEKPLRVAGQSLDEQLLEVWDDLEPYLIAVVFTVTMAVMEWWRDWKSSPPVPWPFTAMAAFAGILAFRKYRRYKARATALKLGRDGERIVGEHLESLRAKGYRVLHDLVGGSFNVDHVLIGPCGIFAIETKTWSKARRADETIRFDGSDLWIRGRKVLPNPVDQVLANARWVREILKSSTSKSFAVTPLVVFPGWFVEQQVKQTDVLVLNPKMLDAALSSRPQSLTSEDISMAAFHLERFVRSTR